MVGECWHQTLGPMLGRFHIVYEKVREGISTSVFCNKLRGSLRPEYMYSMASHDLSMSGFITPSHIGIQVSCLEPLRED